MRKKPFRSASITSPSISILSSLLPCWVEIVSPRLDCARKGTCCYPDCTDGVVPPCEISLLVPPSGVSSRRSRTPKQGVEQPDEVLSPAWRGRCRRRGARSERRRGAIRHPDPRHPGRAQRAGSARQEPHRVGQDACLC